MQDRIWLVGFMGSSKTTVGKLLAQRLGLAWLDMDDELVARQGRSIADIFARDGEQRFRDLESALVQALSKEQARVISTGGGVVLRERNRLLMRESGRVIWLYASAKTTYRRVGGDGNRPLLKEKGLEDIRQMLEQRVPAYRAAAQFRVDTDALTPGQTVEKIYTMLQAQEGKNKDGI